jgi:hypothetical protein
MKKITESEFRKRILEIYQEEKQIFLGKKNLNEDIGEKVLDYVQSALDFIGIVDPTPISDTINGFIYWFRGDRLFAFLTWISALPFLGDLVAKPAVLTLKNLKQAAKTGGNGAEILGVSDNIVREIENALDAGDVEQFVKLVDENGGGLKNIVQNFENPSVIGKIYQNLETIKSVAKRIPFVGGLVTVIDEWVDIFTKASRQIKTSKEISDYYTKALKMGIKPLNDVEKKILTQELNDLNRYRGFSEYEVANPTWWNRYYDGGFGRIYGNRDMRALMNRTKWYLGLLDWLNLGNYIGPEELEKEVTDLNSQIEMYDQTDVAKELAAEDLSGELGMFDKINKVIPQSFSGGETRDVKDEVDPLEVLFELIGM